MNKKIICIGGASIDYTLKTVHTLELSTSNPITSFATLGGVANNVAINLANLTDQVQLQCVIGDDNEGQYVLSNAQKKGITTTNTLILKNKMTSRYYAVLDQKGELHIALADMQIYDHIPLGEFTSSWEHWEKNSIIFADTNLSTEILQYLIPWCEQKQLQLCIDPVSVSKAKKLPLSLAGVFFIKPDRFEAAALTNIPIHSIRDCMKAGDILLKRGAQNVVISLGKSGYVIINETFQKHFPALHIDNILNVSGAGDAFVAGVLFELKRDATLQQACDTGRAAAALAIQSSHTMVDNMSLDTLIDQKNRESHHAAFF